MLEDVCGLCASMPFYISDLSIFKSGVFGGPGTHPALLRGGVAVQYSSVSPYLRWLTLHPSDLCFNAVSPK